MHYDILAKKKDCITTFQDLVCFSMEDLFLLSKKQLKLLLRDYKRKFIRNDPFSSRMTILLGERGIGKSTLIAQYLESLLAQGFSERSILYLPADHFILGERALYEIAETFSLLGGKVICFDEIHKYLNWSQELKSIYDTLPELKVIASGSTALLVEKGSHDLSRRGAEKDPRRQRSHGDRQVA